MAARDLSVEVREFVVETMAATNPTPTAVRELAEDRIYGPSVPPTPGWPFVSMDLPVATPAYDGCGVASRYTFNVHGFAKGDDERAGAVLGAAISSVLDELAGVIVADPEAAITDTVWTGTQVFRDTAEANGWHAVVSAYCTVSG